MTRPRDLLQEGIFWRHGERPPPCLRIVLLDVAAETAPAEARAAIAQLVAVVVDLRRGEVRDLAGQAPRTRDESAKQFHGLTVLVGFGRRLFDHSRHDPPVVAAPRPAFLTSLRGDDDAFPALPWTDGPGRKLGEADLLMQLAGDSEAAVNAAAVELWKAIADDRLPLKIVASFAGFARPDGRGWLDFHDGVSNLQGDDREAAIVAGADPLWMRGGTYLAFLRLTIDLGAWRRLSRAEQELLVGRDKRSGAPLVSARHGRGDKLMPVAAPAPEEAGAALSAEHVDPPQVTDPVIEASHIHRANQNRASASVPGGLRMFRQGYDFLDALGPEPALGLNFISFQRDLSVVQHVLHLPGWLADVNFGGRMQREAGEPEPLAFVKLQAGGLYAVPPRAEPFAGADIFGRDVDG